MPWRMIHYQVISEAGSSLHFFNNVVMFTTNHVLAEFPGNPCVVDHVSIKTRLVRLCDVSDALKAQNHTIGSG